MLTSSGHVKNEAAEGLYDVRRHNAECLMSSSLLARASSRFPRSLAAASAWSSRARPFASDAKRLNLAMLGTGRMGRIRLTGVQSDPRVSIAEVVDAGLTAEQRAELSSQYGTQCFSSVAQAGESLAQQGTAIDGVWIATPTPAHLELVTECAQGGLGREIDAAYDECLKSQVQLFCSFQRRFDPSYAALRAECVDKQSIGKLQSIHTVFRDHPCQPVEFLKTGGDPFHDLAVHDIDYVCDLVGEYPTKVYAHGTSLSTELRELIVMNKASVWLEFPTTGVVCTMDLSRSAEYGYDQRIEVAGERGMLQVLNPSRTAMVQSTKAGIAADTLLHSMQCY
ncbi:hypothetical protein BBJ28_00026734 [Nothophytophthora sp. Chile5]|nr:hypothetical protein BBJ28_00026734 [Nothophytophthora sp. Chile5]